MSLPDERRRSLPRDIRSRLGTRPPPSIQQIQRQGARPAAVLVPILLAGPEPRVVFTERTTTLSRHAGEISFPGGLADPGEDLATTALREAEEELGLPPSGVELVGSLPPVHTHVSGILVVPFVGLLHTDPLFIPNDAEIAEILEFPLATLLDVETERWLERGGMRFQTHVFEVNGKTVWGATARILRSLLDLLEPGPGKPAGSSNVLS
jgi:8-oxo-dGTP pyrophosphatase MutT (NUDIX family)